MHQHPSTVPHCGPAFKLAVWRQSISNWYIEKKKYSCLPSTPQRVSPEHPSRAYELQSIPPSESEDASRLLGGELSWDWLLPRLKRVSFPQHTIEHIVAKPRAEERRTDEKTINEIEHETNLTSRGSMSPVPVTPHDASDLFKGGVCCFLRHWPACVRRLLQEESYAGRLIFLVQLGRIIIIQPLLIFFWKISE